MSHSMNRRTFVAGGLAAYALAALAACKKTGGATGVVAGGAVLKFFITNPKAIDPYNTFETQGAQVVHALFDPLCSYDWDTGTLVSKAAESWEVNDDATEFTFHLVKGATFHNGDPVDAESFKRAWERICSPKMTPPSKLSYHLEPVQGAKEMLDADADSLSGVTCPDEHTLVVKLVYPMADFPYICSHSSLVPVPKAALEDPTGFLVSPIGNGPFKMEGKWVGDQYISLSRFDSYYGEKAKIDGVYFDIYKDSDTAFREFEAGNLDFATIPAGRFKELGDKYGISEDGYTATKGRQVLAGVEAGTYFLTINLNDKTMQDITLRKAISLAINRQAIVDVIYEGTCHPATGIIPPVIDNDPADVWEFCRYDKDAAIKLLDEKYPAGADGKRNLTIDLMFNPEDNHEKIMTIVQSDLEAVGIDATLNSQEWASYLDSVDAGDFQVARMGWNADYPIMDNFLYPTFYSKSGDNYAKYNNPAVDEGLSKARQTVDDEQRKAAYRQVNQMVAADMAVIPLFYYSHKDIVSDKGALLYYSPAQLTDFVGVEYA